MPSDQRPEQRKSQGDRAIKKMSENYQRPRRLNQHAACLCRPKAEAPLAAPKPSNPAKPRLLLLRAVLVAPLLHRNRHADLLPPTVGHVPRRWWALGVVAEPARPPCDDAAVAHPEARLIPYGVHALPLVVGHHSVGDTVGTVVPPTNVMNKGTRNAQNAPEHRGEPGNPEPRSSKGWTRHPRTRTP